MHKSKIFLVGERGDSLIALEETGYMTESTLQGLLTKYPDLLPGDQIDPESPRRWLLVSQEMGVPDGATEGGRWSLDHLFLDQDGIPTFVECKRATDTRIRREVVAQMLDYAANGIQYWSIDRLRQSAAESAERRGESLDDEIARLLDEVDSAFDVEEFWGQVEDNLRSRRVRLVFVADSTPKELRRLVEFLNEEMTHVEVLAVEIKQFQDKDRESQKALVPRVVGLTETARSAKKSTSKRRKPLTREQFMEKLPPQSQVFFQRSLDLAEARGHVIEWGTIGFSIRAYLPNGRLATFAYGNVRNEFHVYLGYKNLIPSGEVEQALRSKLSDFNIFKESGKWTLKTSLTKENLVGLDEVYDFLLDEVDSILETKRE